MRQALIGITTLALIGLWAVAIGGGAGAASTEPAVATTVDITFTEGFYSDDGAHCKVIGDKANPRPSATSWSSRSRSRPTGRRSASRKASART